MTKQYFLLVLFFFSIICIQAQSDSLVRKSVYYGFDFGPFYNQKVTDTFSIVSANLSCGFVVDFHPLNEKVIGFFRFSKITTNLKSINTDSSFRMSRNQFTFGFLAPVPLNESTYILFKNSVSLNATTLPARVKIDEEANVFLAGNVRKVYLSPAISSSIGIRKYFGKKFVFSTDFGFDTLMKYNSKSINNLWRGFYFNTGIGLSLSPKK